MRTLRDTLEAVVETWDDPGDYPSNAGGGPLPSYEYLAGVEGVVEVEIETDDLDQLDPGRLVSEPDQIEMLVREFIADNPREVEYELPDGIRVTKWTVVKVDGRKAVLEVDQFEADAVETPEPDYEPDYEPELGLEG